MTAPTFVRRTVIALSMSIAALSVHAAGEEDRIRAVTDAYVKAIDAADYGTASALLMPDHARTPDALRKDEVRYSRAYGIRTGRKLHRVFNEDKRRHWGASYEVTTSKGEKVEEIIPVVRVDGQWKVMGRSAIPCSLGCFKDM